MCFIDDVFAIWCGPKGTLLEFLNALNSKTDQIKLIYCISESSISFLDLFLYRDTSSNVLRFSTFQKPLNKYVYIPFESFHPSSNKKAFIKGELMRYARDSSSFNSFYETRESSGSDYELGGSEPLNSQAVRWVLWHLSFWILKTADLTHNLTHGSLTRDSWPIDSFDS